MSSWKKYNVDACSLIEVAKRRYPEKFFPKMKELIEQIAEEWRFFVFELIRDELKDVTETDYYKNIEEMALVKISDLTAEQFLQVQEEVRAILQRHPQLFKPSDSTSGSDAWLIAVSKILWLAVITEESKNSHIKIPAVCKDRGVECMNLFDLFEEEKWSF